MGKKNLRLLYTGVVIPDPEGAVSGPPAFHQYRPAIRKKALRIGGNYKIIAESRICYVWEGFKTRGSRPR